MKHGFFAKALRSLSAEKSKDFISDRNEKANTKIIILYLLLLLFGIFLIWIVWNYQVSNFSVSDEWVVESTGEQTFSVSSERTNIYAIGLCNDNTAIDAHVEYGDYSISGTALIKDENNEVVWQKTFTKLSIPTLSIEKLDDFLEETIVLEEGEDYIPILLDENGENISGITWSFYGKDRNVLSLYLVIVTGIFFLFTIMYFQYFRLIRIPFPILWFVLLIGIYVISIFALPIPCVEDGEFHFINAYAISNMIMQRIPGLKSLSEEVPSGVLRMVTYSDAQYLTHFWFDWTYGNDVVARAGEFYLADSMPHYSFIIPAIGITLMRVLRAPYQMYLVAAQLMNVIMFAGVTLLAMRVCPTLQPVIVALSILPSVQWFVNSCSYDVWNLAFCILFVCLCKKMRDSEFVRITDIVLAMVTYILFAPIKTAYFNFALFIYFIEKKQLTQKKFKSTTFFLSIMLIGAEIVVFASRGGEIVAFMGESGFDTRAGLTMDTTYTISWIVCHPIQTMKIFAYTFYVKGWQFPLTFFVNQRLIVAVPRIIRYAFPALFVFICMGTFEKKRISCKEKMLSGIVLITGIVIILTVFLLIYTEKSDTGLTIVAGLQGRYFIPYLLCLPFLVPQVAMATKHIRTAEYVLFLCSVISIFVRFCGVMNGYT